MRKNKVRVPIVKIDGGTVVAIENCDSQGIECEGGEISSFIVLVPADKRFKTIRFER